MLEHMSRPKHAFLLLKAYLERFLSEKFAVVDVGVGGKDSDGSRGDQSRVRPLIYAS